MPRHWQEPQGDAAWRGRDEAYETGERTGPEPGYEGGYGSRQRARGRGRGTGGGQTGPSGGYDRGGEAGPRATPYAGAYLSPVEGYHPQGRGGFLPEQETRWDRGTYQPAEDYAGDTMTWQQDRRQARRIMPKGYRRSDERILEDVYERLSRSGLDIADVEVQVEAGHVTLNGLVSDRSMKHMVEDLVADCNGVEDVENRLRIRPGVTGRSIESYGSDA